MDYIRCLGPKNAGGLEWLGMFCGGHLFMDRWTSNCFLFYGFAKHFQRSARWKLVPHHQNPLRSTLRWIDLSFAAWSAHSFKRKSCENGRILWYLISKAFCQTRNGNFKGVGPAMWEMCGWHKHTSFVVVFEGRRKRYFHFQPDCNNRRSHLWSRLISLFYLVMPIDVMWICLEKFDLILQELKWSLQRASLHLSWRPIMKAPNYLIIHPFVVCSLKVFPVGLEASFVVCLTPQRHFAASCLSVLIQPLFLGLCSFQWLICSGYSPRREDRRAGNCRRPTKVTEVSGKF